MMLSDVGIRRGKYMETVFKKQFCLLKYWLRLKVETELRHSCRNVCRDLPLPPALLSCVIVLRGDM